MDVFEVAKAGKPGGEFPHQCPLPGTPGDCLRNFLKSGGFGAFTTTFEDLHGLTQLPGWPASGFDADG